jgi:hypothetical protein
VAEQGCLLSLRKRKTDNLQLAAVAHTHALTFHAFCRQQFGYGRGTFRHHLLQAQRANRRISLEPGKFYLDLLRYPLTISQERKTRLTILMGMSQVANALGFFWELPHGAGESVCGFRVGNKTDANRSGTTPITM